jgi:5-deoxy-glucuronate isomerase
MSSIQLNPIRPETCIIRDTAARKGRHLSITPGATAARYLQYGRIILDYGDAEVNVDPGGHETGLIVLKGSAIVTAGADRYEFGRYDSLYIPRGRSFVVAPGPDGCDIAEISAPVTGDYPLHLVRFADVRKDPGLSFKTGVEGARRHVNILLGKNVSGGRIVAAVTFSEPGNWTSWPPHEHAQMLEEAYLYIDMPAPSFGVQFVYTNSKEPELATFVREGDVIVLPQGYHPNVAAPGGCINFLWMMAANREKEDRHFGVVNVQPEFDSGKSGLEAALTTTK